MKRIEFIAPVEAMRGNLSGAQKLEYPTDNQGAYEGPVGSVNYARNYSPRFIGAKIARNGKKYFTVRTKTANHLTNKSKSAMALLGGAGAIFAALVMISAAKAQMNAVYVKAQELGEKRTFRAFWMYYIRMMLTEKSASKHVVVAGAEITFKNPWVNTNREVYESTTLDIQIVVKFWDNLADAPVFFNVDGMESVAHDGNTFAIVASSGYNILGLTIDEKNHVRLGSSYLLNEDNEYVSGTQEIENNSQFTTTMVAPL